ncbi:MAG: hypothetical protein KKI07_03910 [Euryarchaeota archaeon]|nr:hypothetical protein [Euryarchaeota archaeon]MDI6640263.1 hypothetical protein [Methanocellales archaeon]MDI6903039.1 hypothetical protein [Methanocellales archaeon]
MAVLSVRVPENIKKEMNKLRYDWPNYIRSCMESKIRELKARKACEKIDEIRSKTEYGVFNSAKAIREDRDL